jgi:hypothetical protein
MDVAVGLIIVLTVGLAAFYIVRHKRRGGGCIGCPYASSCDKCCKANENKKDTDTE